MAYCNRCGAVKRILVHVDTEGSPSASEVCEEC